MTAALDPRIPWAVQVPVVVGLTPRPPTTTLRRGFWGLRNGNTVPSWSFSDAFAILRSLADASISICRLSCYLPPAEGGVERWKAGVLPSSCGVAGARIPPFRVPGWISADGKWAGRASTNDYTLRLTSAPTGNVSIAVSAPVGAPLEVKPSVVTFTPDNGCTTQVVTVTVDDDADAVMHEDAELTHSVSGGDYGGVEAKAVPVTLSETTVPQV